MCRGLSTGDCVEMRLMNDRCEWRTVKVDACLADILSALNNGGPYTRDSCCGHGRNPGGIALADGRYLTVHTDRASWLVAQELAPDHPLVVAHRERDDAARASREAGEPNGRSRDRADAGATLVIDGVEVTR